jgi:hypothetical protein
MTQAQIGLFMRAGPFAGKNLIAFPNEQKIHRIQPHANNRLRCQTTCWTDRDPILGLYRHKPIRKF